VTTPRDALAAKLEVRYGDTTHWADATLSALAAEGWVLVADPWPMDVERLRDWWDSLSELDQFNAYRIEKSNADALAAPDPAPLDVARAKWREAIEAEWYNGNMTAGARDRLLDIADPEEPQP